MMEKNFWSLFWTQFFGALNDNYIKNALVILITFRNAQVLGLDAASIVALSGGIFILPFFLFSATAGQLADKYEKTQLIKYIKIAEIVIMAVAAIGFILNSWGFLLITLFLMGLQSSFFGPIKYGIIPNLVSRQELTRGNAYVEMGTFLAILIGTILGGLSAASSSATALVIVGILGFAIVGFVTSLFLDKVPVGDANIRVEFNPVTPTVRILKYALLNRSIFNSILGISWFWFLGAIILSILPTYVKSFLGGDETVVTTLLAMFTVGIGVGSVLCEKLSFERVEIGLVPIGSLGMSLFLADLYFLSPTWSTELLLPINEMLKHGVFLRLLVDFLGFSIFGGFFIVPLYALVQERSPADKISRIIAANNIVNAFMMVIAAGLLMGMYQIGLTFPQILLSVAVVNLLVAVYIYTIVPEFALRFISWMLVNVIYRLKIQGLENIPREGPVILACNHVTYIDWLIVAGACKRPPRFVMYYKFGNIPIIKKMMKQAKVILIAGKNEDPKILNRAYEKISNELKNGEVICLFPEGELTHNGEMGAFRPGIERILERDPVPVVPITLNGLWGSFFSRKGGVPFTKVPKRFWSRVSLVIGRPVAPESATAESLEKLVKSQLD